MEIRASNHNKYNINYHIVWCTKYRHPVLHKCAKFLKSLIQRICDVYHYILLNIEVMPDHIHLFVSVPPKVNPSVIVQRIKSITATKIFATFNGLKQKYFWGSGLWSRGYYVGTAGTVTTKTIERYIQQQKGI